MPDLRAVEEESVGHLFIGCEWTKRVWFGSRLGLHLSHIHGSNWAVWLRDLIVDLYRNKVGGVDMVSIVCYIC